MNERSSGRLKRVLINSFHFPPIGGAGAQRPVRFVRHLPDLGFQSTVLTGAGTTQGRWTPVDARLGDRVPPAVQVVRTAGPEPRASPARNRIDRWVGRYPASERSWMEKSLEVGRRVVGADVIWTVMAPFTSAEPSMQLSHDLGIPWVADLTDPWALDEMWIFATGLHRARETARMRRVLKTASAIVMTTPEAVRLMRDAFPELRGKPFFAIPCGFDAEDFAQSPVQREDAHFRIVHTGYLHTELGYQQRDASRLRRARGGLPRGVTILPRSHVYLLRAIDQLVDEDPGLSNAIEVHLAGVLSPADQQVAAQSAQTRLCGYLTHDASITLMQSADLLFLPMQKLEPGKRSSMVPGKTYEYLAAGRPILAAIPEGDARDILIEAGNAAICEPDDVSAIATAIRAEVDRWRAGRPSKKPSRAVVERYNAKHLAAAVAAALHEAIERWSAR